MQEDGRVDGAQRLLPESTSRKKRSRSPNYDSIENTDTKRLRIERMQSPTATSTEHSGVSETTARKASTQRTLRLPIHLPRKLPLDDFGSLRDRPVARSLDVHITGLRRQLRPNPSRDLSFLGMTGWRYYPTSYPCDRLSLCVRLGNVDVKKPDNHPSSSPAAKENHNSSTMSSVSTMHSSSATVVTASTCGTKGSSIHSHVSKNHPKPELYAFYGRRPRRIKLSTSDYLTWDNGKRTHEIMFTSAFICPIKKEIFLCGRFGDQYERDGQLYWYSKKNTAEHAAAALALDCWAYRGYRGGASERFCPETPYFFGKGRPLPKQQFPPNVLNQIHAIEREQKPAEY